jgi:hypothetical protein
MELTGNWKRWLALGVIVAVFAFMGGFEIPRPTPRGWVYPILAFLGGAASATVIDHWVGNLDRSNIRWAYLVLGVLLMGIGSLSIYTMHGADVR